MQMIRNRDFSNRRKRAGNQ